MLKIRLQRVGRKNIPVYRIVVGDSKNGPRSGKYIEALGSYDAREKNRSKDLKTEKIKYWISKGAKVSGTMHNFFIDQKIVAGKKMNVLPKKKPIKPASTETSGKQEPKAETKAGEQIAPATPAPEAPKV